MAVLAYKASNGSPGRRASEALSMFELPSQETSMGAPMIPDPEGDFVFAICSWIWERSHEFSVPKRIKSETVFESDVVRSSGAHDELLLLYLCNVPQGDQTQATAKGLYNLFIIITTTARAENAKL